MSAHCDCSDDERDSYYEDVIPNDPLAFIHQTAVHQLRHTADEIEDGHGVLIDFDYDEEIGEYLENMGVAVSRDTEREVTLELTYLLPE